MNIYACKYFYLTGLELFITKIIETSILTGLFSLILLREKDKQKDDN